MLDPELEAQVRAASGYDELFVPALFEEWAPRVVDAARVAPGEHVLDVACGTGIVARHAADRVGPSGAVVGLDANAGMLTVAARRAPGISWKQGMAESLPFEDRSFDVVCCQFGLMFFNDQGAALGEMMRVLKSGGRLSLAVWDRLESNPAYETVVAILQRVVGEDAAAALRSPFSLGDRRALTVLLNKASLERASIATHRGTARFASVRIMVEADLRGWLPLVGILLTEEQIRGVLAAAEEELQQFATADGKVAFRTSAHIVTAT